MPPWRWRTGGSVPGGSEGEGRTPRRATATLSPRPRCRLLRGTRGRRGRPALWPQHEGWRQGPAVTRLERRFRLRRRGEGTGPRGQALWDAAVGGTPRAGQGRLCGTAGLAVSSKWPSGMAGRGDRFRDRDRLPACPSPRGPPGKAAVCGARGHLGDANDLRLPPGPDEHGALPATGLRLAGPSGRGSRGGVCARSQGAGCCCPGQAHLLKSEGSPRLQVRRPPGGWSALSARTTGPSECGGKATRPGIVAAPQSVPSLVRPMPTSEGQLRQGTEQR